MTIAAMRALWDTTLASQTRPRGDVVEYMVARAGEGKPLLLASPSVLEIAYGYERRAEGDPRYRSLMIWFKEVLVADLFSVVAFDCRAAVVAGRLRAAMPHSPARRERRSKTTRQASWLLDIQIAATAFAAGLDVATERSDFLALSGALESLFPAAPPVAVLGAPL
jgi:predicted nucleic acid-binding protein